MAGMDETRLDRCSYSPNKVKMFLCSFNKAGGGSVGTDADLSISSDDMQDG